MGRYFKLDIANKKYRSVLLLSYSIIAIIAVAIVITGVFAWFNSYTQKVVYDMSMVQLQNLDTTFTNSIDTVSYTHLDVYKRQDYGSSPSLIFTLKAVSQ